MEREKKTSQFRVIVESEFPQVEALLNHAESLLSTHVPGISLGLGVTSSSAILNESGVSGGSEGETAFQVPALVKMVETQRAVIADLISLVKNMPVRSLSCESGLGGGTDQEN